MSDLTFLEQFAEKYAWRQAPAKRRFRFRKRVNRGMEEEHRLALTLGGVIDRALDDDEGLQSSDYSTYQIFEADDLVFKLIDLENIRTSRVGYVPRRGIMSPAYIRLEPASKQSNSRYYYWFFYGAYINNIFNGMGGGVRQNLTPTDLLEFPIPLPDLDTQKAIADFLDREITRIDQLIEKKQRLATLLQEQFIAFREYLLSNGAPMRLKFLAKFITSGSRDWGTLYSDDGELFIRIGNISGKGIDLDLSNKSFVQLGERSEGVRTKLKVGDLLVSITANLGSVAIVGPEAQGGYINQHVALVRLFDSKNARFIAHSLQTKRCRDQFAISGNGGTKQGLSLTDVKEVSILLPSVEEQAQRTFLLDARWSKISGIYDKLHESVAHLREHRSALITAAVTGQIDVATWGKKGQSDRYLENIEG